MAFIQGTNYGRIGSRNLQAQTPTVPNTPAQLVSGDASQQTQPSGYMPTQQVGSLSSLPDWAQENINAYNPWSLSTLGGWQGQDKGLKNYNASSAMYGNNDPGYVPFAFNALSAGGAGYDPSNYNLLMRDNPMEAMQAGKDVRASGTSYTTRDINRNPYTGEITGYGSRQEYNYDPQKLQQGFWTSQEPGKGYWKGIDKSLGKQINPFMSQYGDLLNDPLSKYKGSLSEDALKSALLMNNVPTYQSLGANPRSHNLGTYLNIWDTALGKYGTDVNWQDYMPQRRQPNNMRVFR
jgi:hypothetical protein